MFQCTTDKDQLSKIFAASPACFDVSHVSEPYQRLSMKQGIKYWLCGRLPDTSQISPEAFEVAMVYFSYL